MREGPIAPSCTESASLTQSHWLLLPTSAQGMPTIDGVAVPLVNNINNTRALALPQAWVENQHRAAPVAALA